MTKREFMTAIAAGTITDEIKDMAVAELEAMDNANAKRRAKNAEKAEKNQVFIDKLVGFAGSEPKTASDFLADFANTDLAREDGKNFNVQFVSTLARKAVEQGKLVAADVKVAKKGTQKGYTLA